MPKTILRNDAKSILAEIQMIDAEAMYKKASKIATLRETRAELLRQVALIDEVLGASATAPTMGKKRGHPAKTEATKMSTKKTGTADKRSRMHAADIEAPGTKIKDILAGGSKSLGDVADALKLAKPSARNILKSLGKAVKMEGTRRGAKYVWAAK